MQKSALWAIGGAIFGILIAAVVALSIALWRTGDSSDTAQSTPPQSPDTTSPAATPGSASMAPVPVANIEWIKPSPIPAGGALGWSEVTPNYTKTTMIELKSGLFVQLWCRRESGSFFSKVKNALIGVAAGTSGVASAAPEAIEEAKNWTGKAGDAFCIAWKFSSVQKPHPKQLIKGPDLPMTQRAYKGSKPVTEKSELCPGRTCLLGTRGAGADAITTCVELPSDLSPDHKPHSVVVGISNYHALIDKDYDAGTKQWPVAAVGCAQRKF